MKGDKLLVEDAETPLQNAYTCIEPEVGRSVYEYFNSILSEDEARHFEEHLFICFKCQDVVLTLDQIFEVLSQTPAELFQTGKQENKSMKVSGNSCK